MSAVQGERPQSRLLRDINTGSCSAGDLFAVLRPILGNLESPDCNKRKKIQMQTKIVHKYKKTKVGCAV